MPLLRPKQSHRKKENDAPDKVSKKSSRQKSLRENVPAPIEELKLNIPLLTNKGN